MAKIVQMYISFQVERKAKLFEKEQAREMTRRLVEHQLFKLSLFRHFQTPF
jgi:hypothetical protein